MPIIRATEDEKTDVIQSGQEPCEWILVSDKDSSVLKSSLDSYEIIELAKLIRKGDGQVTVFKSTKY